MESNLQIAAATPSTLAMVAGWLAGKADVRFGTKTRWTMQVYMDMLHGKLSLSYLHHLEMALARIWPEGEEPPTVAACLRFHQVESQIWLG